jgi:hypothetical protein
VLQLTQEQVSNEKSYAEQQSQEILFVWGGVAKWSSGGEFCVYFEIDIYTSQ